METVGENRVVTSPEEKLKTIAGSAVIAAMVTGVGSIVFTLVAVALSLTGGASWTAAGLGLVAAALSFGLTANALIRA